MKEKKEKGPTSWLGLPRPERQHFTYSENKLLDQITMEIMTAWANDLSTMKKYFNQTIKTSEKLQELSKLFYDRMPDFDVLLNSESFKHIYENLLKTHEEINTRLAEFHVKILKLETLAARREMSDTSKNEKELTAKIDELMKRLNQPKWYKRLYKWFVKPKI